MSCYFRHLKEIFSEAGIEVNKDNRKRLDTEIHQFLGVPEEDCPSAWKKLKQDILSNPARRQEVTERLRHAVQ